MKLTAFRYGNTFITENMAFQAGDESKKIPISLMFFLLETDDKKILIDVGCDTMPGFELVDFEKPVSVLETFGINKEEITHIIITHSHHDHIDAVRHYPDATVYIQEEELKAAGLYLSSRKNIKTFRDYSSPFANVEIRTVGGHSAGSSIVLIKCNDTKYVLCGDECYLPENLQEKRITGCSCNLEKSRDFIAQYTKPEYYPIVFHDLNLVNPGRCKVIFENYLEF